LRQERAAELHAGLHSSAQDGTSGHAVPQGPGVTASEVTVIKGWADALRNGQPQRAAAFWAHPSAMVNGTDSKGQLTAIRIDSEHDALLADETLSCGATLRATIRNGAYVRALFALSIRTGAGASTSGCSGPASVDFLVRDKHIVRWLRAPVSSGTPEGSEAPGGEKPGSVSTPGAQSS
jgi:hypothetical protein